MKTVEKLLKEGSARLATLGRDRTQAWLEAELLLGFVLKEERTWLVTHGEETVPTRPENSFLKLVARREAHEPIAHLLGEVSFYGRSFEVNRHTLIPRFETELLVDEVKKAIHSTTEEVLVWDVGTGSGAIAITLQALFPKLSFLASDVSAPALRVARKNARRLVTTPPRFLIANLFDAKMQAIFSRANATRFIIVGNLPYLPLSDKKVLDLQVTKYEPSQALFTSADGRYLNEQLLKQVALFHKKDKRPVKMSLEFDPPQADRLLAYAKKYFKNASILKDTCGRARVLTVET